MRYEPEQRELPMLTVYDRPRLLPIEVVSEWRTFRDAVRGCWFHRTRKNLRQVTVADETGMRASHLTEYLSEDVSKRDMPGRFVQAFELSMGNLGITQWFTLRAGLHHMEQLVEMQRRVA